MSNNYGTIWVNTSDVVGSSQLTYTDDNGVDHPFYEEPSPLVALKELYDMYPEFKDVADKYIEWETLKRAGQE